MRNKSSLSNQIESKSNQQTEYKHINAADNVNPLENIKRRLIGENLGEKKIYGRIKELEEDIGGKMVLFKDGVERCDQHMRKTSLTCL